MCTETAVCFISQKMEISVLHTIQSDLAINQEDGIKLFEAIQSIEPNELTISFINISRISTAFLNESIGKYVQLHPTHVRSIKFTYPEGNEIFNWKINDVMENALMGDEYSNLIDNALASL